MGMETYHGIVRTPSDCVKLFEACRLGLLPRVQRRLSEKERQSIKSGSIFVWDEREAGMRRWTDGKSWSASRVSGSFLTYREMEGKRSSGFGTRRANTRSPVGSREEDHDDVEPESYRYKTDGLMKQSFSIITAEDQHLHLISYYSRHQPGEPELVQPSNDPQLRHITPPKGLYPESSLQESPNPPLTRAPMAQYPSVNHYAQHEYAQHEQAAHSNWGPGWHPWPPSEPQHEWRMPAASALPQPMPQAGPPAYTNPYERAPAPQVLPPSPVGNRSLGTGPTSQQLQQAAARAVMIDQGIPTSPHHAHSPGAITNGHAGAYGSGYNGHSGYSGPSNGIPSPRRPSRSPQLSSGPEASRQHRASLSNILHPTPTTSSHGHATAGGNRSGSSSPRSLVSAGAQDLSADARAIRSLNRNFCG